MVGTNNMPIKFARLFYILIVIMDLHLFNKYMNYSFVDLERVLNGYY